MPYFYKNSNSRFLSIDGEDSSEFLQNLITNDINKCKKDNLIYACLLTPQGKFLSDFFIFKMDKKFILETHILFYEKLIKKLNIYKLRSKIIINKIQQIHSFILFGNVSKDKKTIIKCADPRNQNIGYKFIHESANPQLLNNFYKINEDKYHEILIKNLVPFSQYDLDENKSLLLENNFENLNSISWDKGCYIGQEITARMKYRALLKKRVFSLYAKSGFPKNQQIIKENGKDVGKIINVKNKSMLAMIKIEFALNKIKLKKNIETDDGLVLDFVI
ncbi:hypothetical protein IDH28_04120 [Pelagibacterales bacterium SAG-MED31]|nr:hypothetical protein [Pelagibacterales bacterium SAG-MED31]